MKKIIAILSVILLGAVACTKSPVDGPAPDDSGLVEISMTMSLPNWLVAETKAGEMGHNPDIDNIRVAMFGTSGYPQAYTKATLTGTKPTANDTEYTFTVLLPVYEGEAHVHVIANGDESIKFDGQTEDSIMKAMQTTGGVGAYWARIVLEDGVLAQWGENGTMQTNDNHNFIPTEKTADMFKGITLIRNFAEVKLILGESVPLTDVTYTLVNVPTYGSVAPVGSDDKYVDAYATYSYDTATEQMKSDDGSVIYNGYMTDKTINTDIPNDGVLPASVASGVSAFVYERPIATASTTCLLIRGTYNGSVNYYRLDLLGATKPLALYRNYQYQIRIGRLGGKGYPTPAEAMKHNSSDNVSAMVEAKSLTDISDGASRLYVEYIEKNYVSEGTKTFWVKYEPDADGVVDNESVTIEGPFPVVNPNDPNGGNYEAAIESITEGTTSGDYKYYNLAINKQGSEDKVSTFVVKATNGATGDFASSLTRTVTVRVIKNMTMTLTFDPATIANVAGSTTVLNIALSDTLQQSMFPLEFYIEDTKHTLNPTGKDVAGGKDIAVPVKVAKSLVDGTTSSFYFIRTVNWSEYEPMLAAWKDGDKSAIVFKTQFKSLVNDSATEVYVDNEYFVQQSIPLETTTTP